MTEEQSQQKIDGDPSALVSLSLVTGGDASQKYLRWQKNHTCHFLTNHRITKSLFLWYTKSTPDWPPTQPTRNSPVWISSCGHRQHGAHSKFNYYVLKILPCGRAVTFSMLHQRRNSSKEIDPLCKHSKKINEREMDKHQASRIQIQVFNSSISCFGI